MKLKTHHWENKAGWLLMDKKHYWVHLLHCLTLQNTSGPAVTSGFLAGWQWGKNVGWYLISSASTSWMWYISWLNQVLGDQCKPMGCHFGKEKLFDLVGDAKGRDFLNICDGLLVVHAHLCRWKLESHFHLPKSF